MGEAVGRGLCEAADIIGLAIATMAHPHEQPGIKPPSPMQENRSAKTRSRRIPLRWDDSTDAWFSGYWQNAEGSVWLKGKIKRTAYGLGRRFRGSSRLFEAFDAFADQ